MKYTHNYMKIFLDTADTEIINEYFKTGLVDGVTTNPTLIMKSGRNPEEVYQEIKDIGIRDISMEVVGDDTEMYVKASVFMKSLEMFVQSRFLAHVKDLLYVSLFLIKEHQGQCNPYL